MQIYKSEDYDKQSYQGKPSTLIQSFMAVERLELKIGAQVMVIKNLDADLVNGSVGKVIGFGYDAQMDSEDETEPDKKKLKLAAEVGAGRLEMAPRVEFKIHGGEIRQVLMKREEWSVEDSSRITIASRKQVSFWFLFFYLISLLIRNSFCLLVSSHSVSWALYS